MRFRNITIILPLIVLNLIITSIYLPYTFHNNQRPLNEITDNIVKLDLMNSSETLLPDLAIIDNFNDILDSIKASFDGVAHPVDKTTNERNQYTFYGKPQNVLGEDDRVRITPTTSYPWQSIVALFITWGSDTYIATGALIDENHVLTADVSEHLCGDLTRIRPVGLIEHILGAYRDARTVQDVPDRSDVGQRWGDDEVHLFDRPDTFAQLPRQGLGGAEVGIHLPVTGYERLAGHRLLLLGR